MFTGKGFYKGSSILVSGTAGTGKTSIAANFARATCERKERCLFFAFEESPDQIIRNMRSIDVNLEPYVKKGLLQFHASRPTLYGLEMHLVVFYKLVKQFKPSVVILDPITNLITVGNSGEVKSILIRLIDFLQQEQITVMFTALSLPSDPTGNQEEEVSSLVDVWIALRDIELNGERNRGIFVLKSRGMKSSNQVREFVITDKGIEMVEMVIGPNGVLIGSARKAYELERLKEELSRKHAIERKNKEIERRKNILDNQIRRLTSEFEMEKEALNSEEAEDRRIAQIKEEHRKEMMKGRKTR
jgi:circadian clock protein KaiC